MDSQRASDVNEWNKIRFKKVVLFKSQFVTFCFVN